MTTERHGASPRGRDDALERGLRQLLAVEPSPDFLARGRARVAATERAANAWWRGWRSMALGGVAAALVLGFAVSSLEPPGAEPTTAGRFGGVSAANDDDERAHRDFLRARSSWPHEALGTPAAIPPVAYGMLPIAVTER